MIMHETMLNSSLNKEQPGQGLQSHAKRPRFSLIKKPHRISEKMTITLNVSQTFVPFEKYNI